MGVDMAFAGISLACIAIYAINKMTLPLAARTLMALLTITLAIVAVRLMADM